MGLSPVSSSSPYHSHSDVLLVGLSVPLSTCRRNGAVVGFCVFISLTFVLVSSCPPRVFCDSQWIQMHLGLWLPLNTQTIGSILSTVSFLLLSAFILALSFYFLRLIIFLISSRSKLTSLNFSLSSFSTCYFSLITTLAASHKFWFIVSTFNFFPLTQEYELCFNFWTYGVFLISFQLLVSNFTAVWSVNTFCVLLKFVQKFVLYGQVCDQFL